MDTGQYSVQPSAQRAADYRDFPVGSDPETLALLQLPDEVLFAKLQEELTKARPDARPAMVWISRWGPAGLAFLQRRFAIPFGRGKDMVISANTDSWLYVLRNCRDPTYTVWRFSFFKKLERHANQALKSDRLAISLSPDEEEGLPVMEPSVAPDLPRGEILEMEGKVVVQCHYCQKAACCLDPKGTRRCLLLRSVQMGWSLRKAVEESGMSFHHVRKAFEECRTRWKRSSPP